VIDSFSTINAFWGDSGGFSHVTGSGELPVTAIVALEADPAPGRELAVDSGAGVRIARLGRAGLTWLGDGDIAGSGLKTAIDVDGDGADDLLLAPVGSATSCEVSLVPGRPGGFEAPVLAGSVPCGLVLPDEVLVGDFDGDRRRDIYLRGHVLWNEGEWTFSELVPVESTGLAAPVEAAVLPMSGIDALLVATASDVAVVTAKGRRFAVERRIGPPLGPDEGASVGVGDIDGDGRPDAWLRGQTIDVYLASDGGFVFAHSLDRRVLDLAGVADLDGDGAPDLYGYSEGSDSPLVVRFSARGAG
jgi:hypothetical protein